MNLCWTPPSLKCVSGAPGYRLLCGQGLIMACIKSVFNKLELITSTCYTLNEIHLKNVYNIKGNMLEGRDYFHVPTIISFKAVLQAKCLEPSALNLWNPACNFVCKSEEWFPSNQEMMPGASPKHSPVFIGKKRFIYNACFMLSPTPLAHYASFVSCFHIILIPQLIEVKPPCGIVLSLVNSQLGEPLF